MYLVTGPDEVDVEPVDPAITWFTGTIGDDKFPLQSMAAPLSPPTHICPSAEMGLIDTRFSPTATNRIKTRMGLPAGIDRAEIHRRRKPMVWGCNRSDPLNDQVAGSPPIVSAVPAVGLFRLHYSLD